MNGRQRNKYLKRNIPCVHEEIIQECYWSPPESICKASRDGADFCDICKRYKPQYPIKYAEQ